MTTFPGSPKLLKGAIVGLDIFNPVSSIAIFQYNPEQISRALAPQYSEAVSGVALRLAGPPQETISANLAMDLIDQMEQGARVRWMAGSQATSPRSRCWSIPRARWWPPTRSCSLRGSWR